MKNEHIQLDFNFCRRLDFQKNLVLDDSRSFFDEILFRVSSKNTLLIKHVKFLVLELFLDAPEPSFLYLLPFWRLKVYI